MGKLSAEDTLERDAYVLGTKAAKLGCAIAVTRQLLEGADSEYKSQAEPGDDAWYDSWLGIVRGELDERLLHGRWPGEE